MVIDTREKRPYSFPRSVVRGLPAGDYSIDGFEDRVAVERKTHADMYGSLGARRERPAAQPAGPSLDDAYAVLKVSPHAGDSEVKKAYRRLLSQHHPDKLVSKGLPEEMMRLATRKTHEIKQAYEAVKKARGMG